MHASQYRTALYDGVESVYALHRPRLQCPGKLWLVQAMSPGAPPNLYDAQRGLRRKREAAG